MYLTFPCTFGAYYKCDGSKNTNYTVQNWNIRTGHIGTYVCFNVVGSKGCREGQTAGGKV